MTAPATVVVVAFRTPHLDLAWVPADAPAVVVHNDDALDPASVDHAHVTHVFAGRNVGFGAAVNLALPSVTTERVVLCNPDMSLTREHWDALAGGRPDDVVAVPLVDGEGRPTSVVNRRYGPLGVVASGYRLGRLLRRGTRLRGAVLRASGSWGREHEDLQRSAAGTFPLASHWVSGAATGFDAGRLRAVGGFDPGFFLYFEDVDLCRRLAHRFPDMRIVLAPVAPGIHLVGGSKGVGAEQRLVDRLHLAAARRFAATGTGPAWRAAGLALAPRARWLDRR
ncbi:MAG TPA: hypothetical protein VFJ85_17935 [Acidimicrobiales bacterium]|nr:hypothetical protein [Acidimicrobiales bacterium]